ncbi:hypothetical protein VPH35_071102 [Triticum aestivum]|nr:uncharacterized protein LOC123094227 [Triticum aestivum]
MAPRAQKQLFPADAVSSDHDLHSTASSISNAKRSVVVRPRALLSVVLAEVGLPEVKYKTYAARGGCFAATAYFWPSPSGSSAAGPHMRLNGEPVVDAQEAIQNAATLCLENLQDSMDIEFDCPRVKKMKTDKRYLLNSIAGKDREIKDLETKLEKRKMQVNGLGKGWRSFAQDVRRSAGRIDKIAVNYLPTASDTMEGDVAWECYHLTQETDDLCYLAAMSTDAVNTVGTYPCDPESDCSGYDQFPDCIHQTTMTPAMVTSRPVTRMKLSCGECY